ncbi:MAG: tRNA (adenosine(37)-N6)-dimethylallyltransferase MiaA [Cyclobacteriaceae bacterium]|nr:tRNA (adenosine(37)-N6)-dimethylallyltransferase MiaA [Cyclobacteriaceae bacterium]
MPDKLIVITGPTAVGKTKLAAHLAFALNGEVLSADSRQVYRGMDIGTGKDLDDFTVNGVDIRYHLIDIQEAGDKYFINQYFKDYVQALEDVQARHKQPILCGGSGLYIETALEGNPWAAIPINEVLREKLEKLDERELLRRVELIPSYILKQLDIGTTKKIKRGIEIGEYLSTNNAPVRKMPTIEPIIFGLQLDRELVKKRIHERLLYRLENGMIEEVEALLASGISAADLTYYGLEYRWITAYLLGEMDKPEMINRLNIGIRQFAKRQMTWFRRMEKKGYKLHWLDATKPTTELVQEIKDQVSILK